MDDGLDSLDVRAPNHQPIRPVPCFVALCRPLSPLLLLYWPAKTSFWAAIALLKRARLKRGFAVEDFLSCVGRENRMHRRLLLGAVWEPFGSRSCARCQGPARQRHRSSTAEVSRPPLECARRDFRSGKRDDLHGKE